MLKSLVKNNLSLWLAIIFAKVYVFGSWYLNCFTINRINIVNQFYTGIIFSCVDFLGMLLGGKLSHEFKATPSMLCVVFASQIFFAFRFYFES